MEQRYTSGSFSGTDVRIFAMINNTYLKDWDEVKKKINYDYDWEIVQAQHDANMLNLSYDDTDNIGDGEQMLYPTQYNPDNRITEVNQQRDKTLNYLDSMSNLAYNELGEVQTLSYSVYTDKQAVNVLGQRLPKGFTRGQVTIAGTIIFTVLHERILHEILNLSLRDGAQPEFDLKYMRVDELPPLDIFVTFENEYGDKSRLSIFGVEFINEGQVMSVSDLLTENSVNYVARHMTPMRKVNSLMPDGFDVTSSNSITRIQALLQTDYEFASKQIDAMKKRWL